MAEIIPNGDIELYRDIPLDRDYNHTWYFTSANGQMLKMREYLSNQYSTFTNMSYMRSGRNEIKIECAIANLQDVNYMSFINKTPFESRRYFAFVDDIEYINNETTKLHYRIDPIQTYFFDYDIMPSFVEREHAASDGLFENVIPEDFKNMELVINRYDISLTFNTKLGGSSNNDFICVLTRPNQISDEIIQGIMANNYPVYLGSVYPFFVSPIKIRNAGSGTSILIPATSSDYSYDGTENFAKNFQISVIDSLSIENWEIYDMYVVPADLHALTSYSTSVAGSGNYTITKNFYISKHFKYGDTTYTPKNKKLYTSPYKNFTIFSQMDGIKQYDVQKFVGDTQNIGNDDILRITLKLDLYEVPMASGVISVYNYDTGKSITPISDMSKFNLSTLSYRTPYSVDSYSKFLAQRAQGIGFHALVKGFSVIPHSLQTINFSQTPSGREKGVTPQVAGLGAIASGLNAIADIGSSLMNAYRSTDTLSGQFDIDVATAQTVRYGAYLFEYNIRPEQAKIVDDFFTMYGYATKTVKQPNRNARKSFTYVKTINCEIEPKNKGMQNSAKEQIQEIYNHGITFWHSDKTIGDYTVANDPTGNIGG